MTFTTSDLSFFQTTQETYMQDTGKVGVYSTAENTYGEEVISYTFGAAMDCGFRHLTAKEIERLEGIALPVDAEIRLAIDTTITAKDQFKVTHRFAVDTTDETYQVVGEPRRGPSGLQVFLRLVK